MKFFPIVVLIACSFNGAALHATGTWQRPITKDKAWKIGETIFTCGAVALGSIYLAEKTPAFLRWVTSKIDQAQPISGGVIAGLICSGLICFHPSWNEKQRMLFSVIVGGIATSYSIGVAEFTNLF